MESAFSLEQQQGLDGKARDVWGELGSEALRQGNHQVSDQSFVYIVPFNQIPTKHILIMFMVEYNNFENNPVGS
jgi:coatomer protein complex subunit alpha (xenin)